MKRHEHFLGSNCASELTRHFDMPGGFSKIVGIGWKGISGKIVMDSQQILSTVAVFPNILCLIRYIMLTNGSGPLVLQRSPILALPLLIELAIGPIVRRPGIETRAWGPPTVPSAA
jgi:hypothetical protein